MLNNDNKKELNKLLERKDKWTKIAIIIHIYFSIIMLQNYANIQYNDIIQVYGLVITVALALSSTYKIITVSKQTELKLRDFSEISSFNYMCFLNCMFSLILSLNCFVNKSSYKLWIFQTFTGGMIGVVLGKKLSQIQKSIIIGIIQKKLISEHLLPLLKIKTITKIINKPIKLFIKDERISQIIQLIIQYQKLTLQQLKTIQNKQYSTLNMSIQTKISLNNLKKQNISQNQQSTQNLIIEMNIILSCLRQQNLWLRYLLSLSLSINQQPIKQKYFDKQKVLVTKKFKQTKYQINTFERSWQDQKLELKHQINQLKQEKQWNKKEYCSIKTQIEIKDRLIQQKNTTILELQKNLTLIKQILSTKQSHITKEAEIKSCQQEIKSLKQIISQLNRQLDLSKQIINKMKEQFVEKEQQTILLRKQYQRYKNQSNTKYLSEIIDDLKHQIQQKESAEDKKTQIILLMRIKQLQAIINIYEKKIQVIQQTNGGLRKQLVNNLDRFNQGMQLSHAFNIVKKREISSEKREQKLTQRLANHKNKIRNNSVELEYKKQKQQIKQQKPEVEKYTAKKAKMQQYLNSKINTVKVKQLKINNTQTGNINMKQLKDHRVRIQREDP